MQSSAERARSRVSELASRQYDLASFWREVSGVIADVVPHFWVPCWYTLDPTSHLITSHFHDGMPHYPDEWLSAEYVDDDVHQLVDVVRSEAGISTLHEQTGGDPSGSPRWLANIELGGDQELLLRLRAGSGETWGALGLYRDAGRPIFDEDEKAFLRAVSTPLAEGARRALLFGEATEPDWPDGAGLVVVGTDGELESATESAGPWLAMLDEVSVLAVASRARAGDPAGADARVHPPGGPWLTLRAARFAGEKRVAVIIEPSRPARIFELLMSARSLTGRERQVVEHVIRGRGTPEISRSLSISPYTVQEHLKSIFEKLGVRSRRELVAQAFFTHYAPRFRDNERRNEAGLPLRPDPAPVAAERTAGRHEGRSGV